MDCKYKDKCGGCDSIHKAYDEQLKDKQKMLKSLLGEFGKVEPIIPMENPYNYRNKIVRTFHYKFGKEIIAGIYQEGTHKVIPIEQCRIENEKSEGIIRDILKLMKSFKFTAHNEDSGYGLMKHVLIRIGEKTREIMVVLVTSNPVFPSKNNFAKALIKLHPEITTIIQNINAKKTTMVLGERNQVIYGKGYINDILCEKKFKLSPQSFFQVNPKQTEILYKTAIELAELNSDSTIIDAYCGIGTIALSAANDVKTVIGVELNKEAVKDAIVNCKLNNIQNAKFYCEDAGHFMSNYNEKVDVVFMDPPRSGSTVEFIDAIHRLMPQKIVYVSCGPESLKRDLKLFKKKGKYEIKRICPVDMFPMTGHVETVVLLSQQKPDDYVEVEIDLDELDATSAETKTTYEEIKKYVAEHNAGMKVSNLYIAQVKAKYGIIERVNYNKPKSEEARQPQCPKEKEDAIVEALKTFQMI